MENQERKIVHQWKEGDKDCAIYDDGTLVTGSDKQLLNVITSSTVSFIANGTRYFIEEGLSIERWIFMQQLQIEMGFGVEFDEMLQGWKAQYELVNKQKFADAAVQAYNMMNGITKVFQRQPQILRFCALFINTENEDRATITEDTIAKKVEDWKQGNLNIEGFFEFSLLKVKGLAEGYMSVTRSVSDLMENTNQ